MGLGVHSKIIDIVVKAGALSLLCCASAILVISSRGNDSIMIPLPAPEKSVSLDLGEIYLGETADRVVTLKSVSDRTMILSTRTACGCATVMISQKYIESQRSISMHLAYDSGVQIAQVGKIDVPFDLYDTADARNAQRVLSGKVNVFVRPSIEVAPKSIAWSIQYGDKPEPVRVTVINVMDRDIELNAADSGKGLKCMVSPSFLRVSRGDEATFTVSAPHTEPQDHAAGMITISGTSVGRPDRPMKVVIPVHLSRIEPIVAIPGTIRFSTEDVRNQVSKELVFRVCGSIMPSLKSIQVSSPRIGVKKMDSTRFSVSLNVVSHVKTLQETVTFTWYIGGKEYSTNVLIMGLIGVPAIEPSDL